MTDATRCPEMPRARRKRKPTAPCSIDGCTSNAKCRTWCLKHYQRWAKHGDPTATAYPEPTPCTVGECTKGAVARGYCTNHYAIWRRHGDPLAATFEWANAVLATQGLPPVERFWSRVNKDGPVPADRPELGPCWLWLGGTNREAYGTCYIFRNGTKLAHRRAWLLSGRILINGLHLDHLCRNHPCVNPGHIEQVPPRINYLRGNSASARNARKTHCKRRHEYTAANTRRDKLGRRHCRACVAVVYRMRRGSIPVPDRKVSDDYRLLIMKEPCRYCGGTAAHADHFYPALKRPGDYWWRFVPACGRCNITKSDRCGTWFLLRPRTTH